jgi:hypothetical protein
MYLVDHTGTRRLRATPTDEQPGPRPFFEMWQTPFEIRWDPAA